ncbi:MFS general substrate transporter [Coprinopsis marcescibilis]|uniref:MFS general substrate transporter n=1 Tax=Coprinopsis marcescibilis TaxID=230819 RepID=A0A5C3KLD1_COPMA|nr:MFS general substrate transporter [Coprinopsis marcescibilis]
MTVTMPPSEESNEQTPLLPNQAVSVSGPVSQTRLGTYETTVRLAISHTTVLSWGIFLSIFLTSLLPGISLAYLPLPPFGPTDWKRSTLTNSWIVFGPIGALLGAANVNQYGIRKLYLISMSTMTLTAALTIVAPTWLTFIFARVLQSIAVGPVVSLGIATFAKIHAAEKRGLRIAYLILANCVGIGFYVMIWFSNGFYGNSAHWRFNAALIAAAAGLLTFWLHHSLPHDAVAIGDGDRTFEAFKLPSANIFSPIYQLVQRPKPFLISLIGALPLLYLPLHTALFLNHVTVHDLGIVLVIFLSCFLYAAGAFIGIPLGGALSDRIIKSRMPHATLGNRVQVPSTAISIAVPLSFISLVVGLLLTPFDLTDRTVPVGLLALGVSFFLGVVTGETFAVSTICVAEWDPQISAQLIAANEVLRLIVPTLATVLAVRMLPHDTQDASWAIDAAVLCTVIMLSALLFSAFRWVSQNSSHPTNGEPLPDQAADTLEAPGGSDSGSVV